MGSWRAADGDGAAATRYRYCHPCGYEYVPAMTTCTECGQPLVDEPPPPPPPPPVREHGTATVSVAGLGADDRQLLEMLLRGEEVPTQWTDDAVVVPIDRATTTHDLIAELTARDREAGELVAAVPAPHATVAAALRSVRRPDRTIAARWRRFGGWFVDATVVGLAGRGLAERGISWWLIGILVGLYWIVATAVWGATFGKLVAGTRVTVAGGRPSWWVSTVRWAVTGWIGFAVGVAEDVDLRAASVIGVLAVVTLVATYVPILWDGQARGLHDRLAGTVVVRRPTADRTRPGPSS